MKSILLIAPLAIALTVSQSTAQQVGDCEGSLIGNILPEMSQDTFVSFANGAIRVADIYVDANLASSVVIVVMHPRPSDLQGAGHHETCSVIYSTRTQSPYFGQVFLRQASASYDATSGLTLSVPVRYYCTDQDAEQGTVTLSINQRRGEVVALEE